MAVITKNAYSIIIIYQHNWSTENQNSACDAVILYESTSLWRISGGVGIMITFFTLGRGQIQASSAFTLDGVLPQSIW